MIDHFSRTPVVEKSSPVLKKILISLVVLESELFSDVTVS